MSKREKLKDIHERQDRQHREMWEKSRQRLERDIAAFQHAHVSNAKWRRLFRVVASPELRNTVCYWKTVANEREFSWGLPPGRDLLGTHTVDGALQPIGYGAIEWIEIPANFVVEDNRPMSRPPKVVHRDVDGAL